MIILENVSKVFKTAKNKQLNAVNNVSLKIEKGEIYGIIGFSGAGKSTLINAIIPGFKLKTDEISQALGRGKHTTRITSLYHFKDGYLGDTPGFSKLDLHGITKDTLKDYFVEFKNFNCKFRNCLHLTNTLGCEVVKHVGKEIMTSRYNNYLRMLSDIAG